MKNLLKLLFLSLMINVKGKVAISTDGTAPNNSALSLELAGVSQPEPNGSI